MTVGVLAAVVFAVYGRALHAPFIFDDRPGIVENPTIRRLWPLIGDERTRGPLRPPPLAPTARRPLPNLSFALDYRVGGLDPTGYRVVNLLLHVLVAVLLAAVLRRTLVLPRGGGLESERAWAVALAAAVLFAVHPLATEAVAYVTQRTELLAACGLLAALWASIRYWARDRAWWLALAGVAGLAGMASKEWAAALPLVVALYERTFVADSWRAVARSWRLYATLALGWLLLVLQSAGGISGMTDARHQVSFPVWWLTQAKVLLLYGKLVVWPWPLSIHYAPRYLSSFDAAWPWLAMLAAVGVACLVVARRRPAVAFVLLASLLVLAPTLVLPVPKMVAAERRMYLPLAALIALAVAGGARWLAARRGPGTGRVGMIAVAVLTGVLAAVSVTRLGAYASASAIWRDAVAHQPDDAMAHYNLGTALLDEGRPAAETLPHFEEAVRLDPDYPAALDNLAMALNRLGRPEEALTHLAHALAIEPDDAVAYNNLGIALTHLGRAEEALPYLQRALELDPEAPKSKVHVNIGNALLRLGRTDEAVAHFERAVDLAPADADVAFSLGGGQLQRGETVAAIATFERALQLSPDDVDARNSLASALLQRGQVEPAIAHWRRAIALRPTAADLHSNLGTALLMAGRRDEAMVELEAALRLQPDHLNAQRNLGAALAEAGRPREAIARFRQALRLAPDDAALRLRCAQAHASLGERADAVAMATRARELAEGQGNAGLAAEIATWLGTQGTE